MDLLEAQARVAGVPLEGRVRTPSRVLRADISRTSSEVAIPWVSAGKLVRSTFFVLITGSRPPRALAVAASTSIKSVPIWSRWEGRYADNPETNGARNSRRGEALKEARREVPG